MRTFFTFILIYFAATLSQAQTLKPIAQLVANAKSQSQGLRKAELFHTSNLHLQQRPEAGKSVSKGVLLEWDDVLVDQLRSDFSPVELMLPFEQNSNLILELVPAKNFTDEFQVTIASQSEPVTGLDLGVHYWGIVQNDPTSVVAISIYGNEVFGLISTRDGNINLGLLPGDKQKTHILFREQDMIAKNHFECQTDDELHQIGDGMLTENRSAGPTNCVKMFIEADFTLFQNKGSVANVVSYMNSVMSQVSALYTNESVNLVLNELYVWNVNDPYTGPSASEYLNQFRTTKAGAFNGNAAHLVGIHNLGGIAYVDALGLKEYCVGYSSIASTVSNVPVYSWTTYVLAHEIGHNLASKHTHACAWNGNNTPIDGCGPSAGASEGCTAALPTNGGTVMSYCHLLSTVGINFANGFGPQPGDLIRNRVYNSTALAACTTTPACTYGTINSANFDSGLGIWTDGGTDCDRILNTSYANSPSYSMRLRDNTTTSVITTSSQSLAAYSEIKVSFSYITVSCETGEDFWLQISTNGGTTYTTKATYRSGTEFTNGVRKSATVTIPGPFTSTTRFRFRADASDDDDQVYIDDVVITGCKTAVAGELTDRTNQPNPAPQQDEAKQIFGNITAGPNPASDTYRLSFVSTNETPGMVSIIDLTGRVMMNEKIRTAVGENQFALDISPLPNGIYFVHLHAGNDRFVEKMMVVK